MNLIADLQEKLKDMAPYEVENLIRRYRLNSRSAGNMRRQWREVRGITGTDEEMIKPLTR